MVNEASLMLNTNDKGKFRTIVITLLYLSKRVLPGILCAVSFTATRVPCAVSFMEDFEKCSRVLKSVNKTKDIGIKTYNDASCGVHMDGKTHTGVLAPWGQVRSMGFQRSKS